MSEITSANQQDDAGVPRGRIARGRRLVVDILRAETDRTLAQRTAVIAFFIRASSAAIALVSQILLARWLGSHEYGVFAFAFVTLVIVGGLLPMGFPTAGQRFIAEYAEAGQSGLLRGFLDGSRLLMVAIGTTVSLLGALGLWLFGDLIDRQYLLPLYLILVCLPAYALMEVQDGIARNYSWIDLALALPYLVRPLIIIAIVGGTMLAAGSADAITGAYALIGAIWFTGVLQTLLLELRLRRRVPKVARVYAWKPWVITSLPIFLVESFYMLLTNTDVLVLSIYESPDKIGIYYAAVKTLALISFVPFAVTAASAHKYAEYGATGDRAKLEAFVRDTVNWTFWPALAATLAMLAAGKPLLWLFGPEFVDGYPLLFILVLGLMARAMVGPVDRVMNMLGQQNVCALIYAVAFALNLVLNFTLIPLFGLAGAAWATSLALIAESILLFFGARARLGLHVFILNGKR
ncbi:lipopolysaccharide biosynthesis protein [Microbaculum marinisediminis]|uniref:Polysaccharide biosynthesis C-terminal domain-containing protein n=1 Tax=Microbaculum marinisediminis TaxID=2931392 RepID=A0AAW5R2S8_9HYPH|nr:polysaccharide biosynthesis C-terminal domain-containing protein [Microbaculum sp. A6E488]MCT8974561.1 polysaccharide biosynthesis C-terminal domain-containing protein [Microbaculum sp. A6E488]